MAVTGSLLGQRRVGSGAGRPPRPTRRAALRVAVTLLGLGLLSSVSRADEVVDAEFDLMGWLDREAVSLASDHFEDPSLRLLVLWLGLLGAMVATRENHHIRIDLIPQYLPPRLKRPVARVTDLFSAVVCLLLAWHGGRFVLFEAEDGMLFIVLFPIWLAELIIPLAFGIIGLRFLLNALLGGPREPAP